MKQKLAIIGANEFQNPLILKAKELGYETHVFAWAAGAVGEKTADVFHPISIVEKDEILAVCRREGVIAACSIGSDLAIHTVNHVQRALGMPANPPETDFIATNKFAMREAFAAAGVDCPRFKKLSAAPAPEELADFHFPVIVKPTDRSGSRGVFRCENPQEVLSAVPAACECSFEKCAIVEEFLFGDEYSCESISHHGEHHLLAVTKKFTTGAPHFIETGHLEPAPLSPEQYALVENRVKKALDALHIRTGAGHTEFMLTPEGDFRVVEIGSRMGGDCIGSDLVPLSTGIDFVRAVIDTAVGKAPELTPTRVPCRARIRFLFTPEDAAELRRLQTAAPEALWRFQCDDDPSAPVSDSSNRHGFYITTEKI